MPIYTTLQQNNQSGIAVAQNTDADNNFTVPDRSLNLQKFSLVALETILAYSAVVGQTQDVMNGIAQYTSIQSAVTALSAGGSILVLPGTYTENITVATANILIEGRGPNTILTGSFSAQAASCAFLKMTFNGSVTFTSGSSNNFMIVCWQTDGNTFTNSGTANAVLLGGE